MTRPTIANRHHNLRLCTPARIAHFAGALVLCCSAASALAQNGSLPLFDRSSPGQHFISTNQLLTPRKAQQATDRAKEDFLHGRFQSAEKHLARALEVAPHYAVALAILGAIRLQAGNVEGAARNFQTAVDDDPTLGAAYLGMGMVLMNQAKFKEALTPLHRATELLPGSWYVHVENALAHVGMGDTQAALKEAALVEGFAGTDPQRSSGVSWVRAMAFAQMKDKDRTKKYLDETIARNPDGPYATLAKGVLERAHAGVTDRK